MKMSTKDLMFFDTDDQFLAFCLSETPTIKYVDSIDRYSHDYNYTQGYLDAIKANKGFIIRDPKSLITKRGCVCRGLITKPVENLYMLNE